MMHKVTSPIIYLGILSLIVFASCTYQSHNIKYNQKTTFEFVDTKNNIELKVNTTEKVKESKQFNDFLVLGLELKNKSNKPCTLNTNNIKLPLTSIDEIKNRLPSNCIKHYIPSSIFLASGILIWWQVCFPLAILSSIGGFLYGKNKNTRIINNLCKITLQPNQTLTIKPNKKITKLLFIKKENYKPKFKISIDNTTFDVWIKPHRKYCYKIV